VTPAPIWLRDPCAILAEDAARGIVVDGGRIVETVPAGAEPKTPGCAVFDAGRHVVLPGLINTHHHFYQTLTRATPAALDRELFPWLTSLYPIWARLTPDLLDSAATVALAELLLSGCTTTTDHHYVFPAGLEQAIDIEIAAAQRLARRADPRVDEPLAARWRIAARQGDSGRGHDPRRQRSADRSLSPARCPRDGTGRAGTLLAV
jgi:8-oxoguanine deaminase